MNLDFISWYNYGERRIKKITARTDYTTPGYLVKTMSDTQFNENDGISTLVILENFSTTPFTVEPNYVIAWYTDENNQTVIESRWFLMEMQRTRKGQWRCTLRRDVIAEYWNNIKECNAFIDRGDISYNSPLVFNDEGMTFNQIKVGEYALKDKTNCPWLVGYVAKYSDSYQAVNLSGTILRTGEPALEINTTIANDPIANVCGNGYNNAKTSTSNDLSKLNIGYVAWLRDGNYWKKCFFGADGKYKVDTWVMDGYPALVLNQSSTSPATLEIIAQRCADNAGAYNTNAVKLAAFPNKTFVDASDCSRAYLYNGKVIKDSDNKYYKIHFEQYPRVYNYELYTVSALSDAYRFPELAWDDEVQIYHTMTNDTSRGDLIYNSQIAGFFYTYRGWYEDVTLQYYNGEVSSCTYDTSNHISTSDAPYNIIAVPYLDGQVKIGDGTPTPISKEIGMEFMTRIAKDSSVYDIQLLPYCPYTDFEYIEIGNKPTIKVPSSYQSMYYSYIKTSETSEKVGIIFNVEKASFSFVIDAPEDIKEGIETNARQRKIKALTKFTRLCSPNYSGVFQFNKQKNDGLEYFEVNCTYRPMSPYIHINPNFGGLYGSDYNDNRGLICQGDFSLPMVKSAWAEYQLQNKNFQNLFNRQIEHMETEYDIQNTLTGWNIAAGVMQGAGTGAAGGAMVGGGIGAAVGGVVGGVTSLGGGLLDLKYQKELLAENLSYTKDTFNMQLGNIKAIPNSLTRIGTFDIDNKIFPFVEEYDCTLQERTALSNKIITMGFNVGIIGQPYMYSGNGGFQFVQGKLIEVLTSVDSHLYDEIYTEFAKGVRIYI